MHPVSAPAYVFSSYYRAVENLSFGTVKATPCAVMELGLGVSKLIVGEGLEPASYPSRRIPNRRAASRRSSEP
jgi:hypothetical protein